jgi:hypothetical protein
LRRNRRIAERAGQVERAARYDARLASLEALTEEPEPEPETGLETGPEPDSSEPDERADGVHALGGGWHEIVADGAVVEKLRGAEAAEEAYEAFKEVKDGD